LKHTEIKNIFEKRFEKINTAFDKVRMHLHEEDIRVFRVKVKKLAACLRLINGTDKQHDQIKVPRKIEKAFKISGDLRILQMQQNRIQKALDGNQIASPESYLKEIAEKILHQTALLNDYVKGPMPLKKAGEKILKSLPENIEQKNVHQFIRSEGDRLANLLTQVFPTDKSLHEVRKLLKSLLYISPYTEMELSDLFPFTLLSSYDYVDTFTTILGSFHDLEIEIDFMHTACQKIGFDENEKAALRSMETLWISEREDTRTKIYDEIKKIIASGRTVETGVEWLVM